MRGAAATAARAAVLVASAALSVAALVACGASPSAVGPSGIDGLTIPTPSPDPADFSAHVDNPWFPLAPGTTWTYRRYTSSGSHVLTATVLSQQREIAGVPTTAVRWQVERHGRPVTTAVRWYAQDRSGNVWWFGQDLRRTGAVVDPLARRSWQAGRAGAQAGLVLSAVPRVGDGYTNALVPGTLERRSTVISLTASIATPQRTYRDAVLTRDASDQRPTLTVQTFFVRGIGMVAQQATDVTSSDLALVDLQRPG